MDITTNKHNYSFPMLKNGELLQCLSDLGLELTETELMEPNRHRDRVRAVFVMFVEYGLHVTSKELATISIGSMERKQALPFPELHNESFAEVKFFLATMYFMKICGVHDFGWRDLQAPSAKRFRRQLSGAINYIKYREDQLSFYSELEDERRMLIAKYREAEQEQKLIVDQLEQSEVNCNREWEERKEVEQECADIEREIAQQNKLQTSIRQDSTELKKKLNELKNSSATLSLALEEAIAEENHLSDQIVQSPTRLQHEMSDLTKKLEEERRDCYKYEKESENLKKQIEFLTQAEQDVIHATKVAEDTFAVLNEHNDVQRETEEIQKVVQSNKVTCDELEKELHHEKIHLRHLADITNQNREQHKIELSKLDKKLSDAKKQLQSEESDRLDRISMVEAREAKLRELKEEMENESIEAEEELNAIIQQFKNFEHAVLKENRLFMECLSK